MIVLLLVVLRQLRHTIHVPPYCFTFTGWSKLEAVDSAIRKSGFHGPITESLRRKVRLTRYRSSRCSLHYAEYVDYVQRTRGYTPKIPRC